MKTILALLALPLLLLSACTASPDRMNKLSVGMTKAQVISAMGNPTRASAQGGAEYLVYRLNQFVPFEGNSADDYYIRLTGGRVDEYGKAGDFKLPESVTLRVR